MDASKLSIPFTAPIFTRPKVAVQLYLEMSRISVKEWIFNETHTCLTFVKNSYTEFDEKSCEMFIRRYYVTDGQMDVGSALHILV